jgi:60 kDa SS-A/Ro ribonucleoprotein
MRLCSTASSTTLACLRTYVQILRSGVVGRKSLGTAPKRLVREWLARHGEYALFSSGVGQSPSLSDIVKMVHPKPESARRAAFYGYLLGRSYEAGALPPLIRKFEQFKNGESADVPPLPFHILSALPLSQKDWRRSLAMPRGRQRMNLNTFARHGVFEDPSMVALIADRLRDPGEIQRARVFPYQLLAAFLNVDSRSVPVPVKEALQDAMELAIANVPEIAGKVVVCPDVSGSMRSPVTGHRQGATTSVRCVDVAVVAEPIAALRFAS